MTHRVPVVIGVLILVTLACGQYAPTVTPTAQVVPASSLAPLPATIPPTSTPPLATVSATEQTARVVRPVVRVHKAPGSAEIVGYLHEGDSVIVEPCIDNWCLVHEQGLSGYVYQGCLDTVNVDKKGCEAE